MILKNSRNFLEELDVVFLADHLSYLHELLDSEILEGSGAWNIQAREEVSLLILLVLLKVLLLMRSKFWRWTVLYLLGPI